MPRLRTVLACAALALALPGAPTWADEPTAPVEGTTIHLTSSQTWTGGRFVRPDPEGDGVILIETDHVILDLGGATLVGTTDPDRPANQFEGIGIHVRNAKGVTIMNGRIRGFKVAVRAENALGLRLLDLDASGNFRQRLRSTPVREDVRDWLRPHDNDHGEWEARYGAGFSLTDCKGATVAHCVVHDGQNGVLLTRCRGCRVYDNGISFNSGWGVALYRSLGCEISHNRCDWCVRGYSHGIYHRGQDSAGILLFEQCIGNVIAHNSATHSGDGLFLYAGHDTTQRTGEGGSNGNIVYGNDFSHAVANGIEATFSERNVFIRNDVSDSDHGFWLGYSYKCRLRENTAKNCLSAGISIEHGQGNRIHGNLIEGGRSGIHLWWDDDEAFVAGVYGKTHDTSSSRNRIVANTITGAERAIRLDGDRMSQISDNVLQATKAALALGPRTRGLRFFRNRLQGAHGGHTERPALVENRSGAPFEVDGSNRIAGRFRPIPPRAGPGTVTLGAGEPLDPRPMLPGAPESQARIPQVRGEADTAWPAGLPRGRSEIRIDEWGPLHPLARCVFPRRVVGGRSATFHVLGRGSFRARTDAPVVLAPQTGTSPGTIGVRAQPGQSGLVPFDLDVEIGGQHFEASGLLVVTRWKVRFFEWTVDPREDEKAFTELVQGRPVVALEAHSLDFPWKAEGPVGVRPDRFATVATTALRLPKGRYRIRTVSDDGIRVSVDGKRVIDHWTHHAPTEDVATIHLEDGEHTLQVEHFELDGWAHLSFTIEPLPAATSQDEERSER